MMTLGALFTLTTSLVLFALAQDPQPATAIADNPNLVTYQAIFQASKPIQGTITGVSAQDGNGVDLNINFYQFPDPSMGPFAYHIHVNPVPEDGNCTAAGGHLDPYNVTDAYVCTDQPAETCQVGDLSGKHGKIDTTTLTTASYQTHYLDLYLSTVPDTTAFFGNRSIVIHAANGTRVNCGNFVLQSGDMGGNGSTNGSYTSSGSTTSATGTGATGVGATGTSGGTMPSQSIGTPNEGVTGATRWSASVVFGMGVVTMALAAL